MGVVVETGTGLANANSFIAVSDAITYAADRGLDFATDPTEPDAIAAVIKGGDYLRNELRFLYRGLRMLVTQRMPYPRTGASERGGGPLPDGIIPWRLIDTQCELAILSYNGVDLQEDLENGGLLLASDKTDVLEESWFKPEAFQCLTRLPGETVRVTVLGYLAPLLRLPGSMPVTPALAQACDRSPFVPGQFDDPARAFCP